MDACHMLFGNPWQNDTDITYRVAMGERLSPKVSNVEGKSFLTVSSQHLVEDLNETNELMVIIATTT